MTDTIRNKNLKEWDETLPYGYNVHHSSDAHTKAQTSYHYTTYSCNKTALVCPKPIKSIKIKRN